MLEQFGIRFRRPSESAIRIVLGRVDGDALDRVLGAFTAGQRIIDPGSGRVAVAIDGKTVRGARERGTTAPHLVSALAHDGTAVFGQRRIYSKSNEIPAVRKLLKDMMITGCVLTLEVMHTHVETAKAIRRVGGEYVMTVKANQPGLYARVRDQPWAQIPVGWSDPVERGHGREERRSYKIVTVTRGLGFPYAKQLVQVTRKSRDLHEGDWSVEIVYVICSLPAEHAPPRCLAEWIRGHWSIENKLHHVRDTTYREDASRVRTGDAPQVLASMRNTAIALHHRDGATNIARACRILAAQPARAISLVLHGTPSSQAR
jgi:predicted transposase YbfD/YdcC